MIGEAPLFGLIGIGLLAAVYVGGLIQNRMK